jgi:hypothetical protein
LKFERDGASVHYEKLLAMVEYMCREVDWLEEVPLVARRRLQFERDGASVHYEKLLAMVEYMCREVDWLLRADCMASSVVGSNSDGCFCCVHA